MKKTVQFLLVSLLVLGNSLTATAQQASVAKGQRILFLQKTLQNLEATKKDYEFKQTIMLRYGEDIGLNLILNNAEEITMATAPIAGALAGKLNYKKEMDPKVFRSRYESEEHYQLRVRKESIKFGVGMTAVSAIGTEALLRLIWFLYNINYSKFYDEVKGASPEKLESMFLENSQMLEEVSGQIDVATAELEQLKGSYK